MGNYRDVTQGPEESGDQDASRVHVSGSSGVQVGSGNVQYNFFGDSPAAGRSGSAPATRPSETADPDGQGHAFISYVHEDAAEVDWLQQALESAGVPVWRDTVNLWPGEAGGTRSGRRSTATLWCSSPVSPAAASRGARATSTRNSGWRSISFGRGGPTLPG